MSHIARAEISALFDCISQEEIIVPDFMNTRELLHLQDFHKYIIAKNLNFVRKYGKLKVENNWDEMMNSFDKLEKGKIK